MRSKLRWLAVVVLLAASTAVFPALPSSSLDEAIDSLFAVHKFREVRVSPDGKRVAWVESLKEGGGESAGNSAIRLVTLGSPKNAERISAGDGGTYAEHDIAWSHDSKRLAFLSDKDNPGQLELYVADLGGQAVRKLTSLTGFLDSPSWSPDGKTVALLFTENAPREAGPLVPMIPPSGEVEQRTYEQRLTVVDVASGRVRQASPDNLYIYEFDWSPDGKKFAVTAAPGNGDANWWIAQLGTVDAATGETKFIYKPPRQIAQPRWSPDGKTLAFIAGIMSDEGSTGGDIWTIPATGGEARNLTPGIKASPAVLVWLSSSEKILFTEQIDGASGIAAVDSREGKVETLWSGPETISSGNPWDLGISLASDGKISALIRQSFQQPPEIWAGEVGAWRKITQVNAGMRPRWGKSESIHWWSDGMRIQGWLLYPADFDSTRRYPMVVSVHGGPGAAERPSWPGPFFSLALLSSEGYFVLCPNPRGSFGMGEAVTEANVRDFGYGDFRDILAGVDSVVKTLPVDGERVGIAGWSYGGYMSLWAVSQTNRFRAAVAGAGIANWQSYYGQNDIGQWMIPFFGASVYDDPGIYARSSPISFVKNVKTPTLMLVGDGDGECPAAQSTEFWRALKTLGVETRLVIYPGEGHSVGQPEHVRDTTKRTIEWFNQHLKSR